MPTTDRRFLPALGPAGQLRLYEPFIHLMGARPAQLRLVAQAGLAPGQSVLEIGSGTGAVLRLVKRAMPTARVTGLDPDAEALALARRLAARDGLAMDLDVGFADALPYADDSVDRVLSSFMFHHVPAVEKPAVLAEIRRVLAPGGSLHIMDFDGGFSGPLARVLRLGRGHRHGGGGHGHGHGHGHDAGQDEGPVMDHRGAADVVTVLREAGFADAEVVGEEPTRVGPARYYRASL